MTIDNLCEEFRLADENKLHKKRPKRKNRRQGKLNENKQTNQINKESDSMKILSNITRDKILLTTRRRTSSCCSCLCHYCDERSNSLSIIHTTIPTVSLVKSHSCPSSLLFTCESLAKTTDQVINKNKLPLSSSLETLFSSISTRECVCHERISGNKKKERFLLKIR